MSGTVPQIPNQITQAYFVLDRSGSMASCLDDTIKGFNQFVEEQKNVGIDQLGLTLVTFDDVIETVYHKKPIADVSQLNRDIYIPRNSTALLDAIGETIKTAEKDNVENNNVIIAILTDGLENSSKNFDLKDIHKKISEKRSLGWKFIFLGANQDAIRSGEQLGIDRNLSKNYTVDKTPQAFKDVSQEVTRIRETYSIERTLVQR